MAPGAPTAPLPDLTARAAGVHSGDRERCGAGPVCLVATTGAAPPEPCQARPIYAVSCGFGRGSIPFSSAAAMKNTARPFQLRPLPSSGCSLPALRSRQHLLLHGLRRDGAAALAARCRAALPEQPPGPSQACAAPAAVSRTPAAPGAGESQPRAESDASPFDPRAAASCCAADAARASRNAALRAGPARQGVPMRSLRPVLRASGLSGPASGPAPGTRGVRWPSTRRPAPRSCACITSRSGRSARSHASPACIATPSSASSRRSGSPGTRGRQAVDGRSLRAVHHRDAGILADAAGQPSLPDGVRTRLSGCSWAAVRRSERDAMMQNMQLSLDMPAP